MFEAKCWLDDWLLHQKVYQNVVTDEMNLFLLPLYLDEAERKSINNNYVNQGMVVKSLLNNGDLNSKAIIFHEMIEVEVYRSRGFTNEEIADWTAHNKIYHFAHNIAENYHLNLIHDAFMDYSGFNLDLEVILMTQPQLQILDPDFRQIPDRISRYAIKKPNWQLVRDRENYVDIEFDSKQVRQAIGLFQKFGGVYDDSNVEEKILECMFITIENENRKNKFNYNFEVKQKKRKKLRSFNYF